MPHTKLQVGIRLGSRERRVSRWSGLFSPNLTVVNREMNSEGVFNGLVETLRRNSASIVALPMIVRISHSFQSARFPPSPSIETHIRVHIHHQRVVVDQIGRAHV